MNEKKRGQHAGFDLDSQPYFRSFIKQEIIRLLDDYQILIKDCSTKKGFEGKNYIRIAVRDEKDNGQLCRALREIMGESNETGKDKA